MDDLPQEIVDQIIDNLHLDFKALKACSLTCHRWLPSAKCHLPLFMLIKTRTELKLLLEVLELSFSPVKRLQLHISNLGWPILNTIHAPLWRRFKHLDHLSISAPDTPTVGSPLEKLMENFPTITSLTIINAHFDSLHRLLRCLRIFPRLTHLQLVGVQWDTNKSGPEDDPAQAPSILRHLTMCRMNWRNIFEEMLLLDTTLQIRNLSTDAIYGGPSTRELYIRFIERCPRLRKLCLHGMSMVIFFYTIFAPT